MCEVGGLSEWDVPSPRTENSGTGDAEMKGSGPAMLKVRQLWCSLSNQEFKRGGRCRNGPSTHSLLYQYQHSLNI